MPDIKNSCDHCKESISFDSANIGEITSCPHCFNTITLKPRSLATPVFNEPRPKQTNEKDSAAAAMRVLVIVSLAIAIAVFAMVKLRAESNQMDNSSQILEQGYGNMGESMRKARQNAAIANSDFEAWKKKMDQK